VRGPLAIDVSVARNDEERVFLTSLGDGLADLTLDVVDAYASAVFEPLLVSFDVAGVTTWRSSLDIFFKAGHLPWLYGSWSGGGDDLDLDWSCPSALTVRGLDFDASQAAAWSIAWLGVQLRRVLLREEWGSAAAPVASTWRFADTGEVLGKDGASTARFLHRKPSRVVRVRPQRQD
jgi:hypothetical protein